MAIALRSIICSYITGLIPKNKNLILFTSWFGKKYSDSSKYLFEYMLAHYKYDIYWYTSDYNLYRYLQTQRVPVVYSKSIKGIWYHVRAIMLVSSVQFDDYNPYFTKGCYYLDLGHGFPGKPGGLMTPGISKSMADSINRGQKNTAFYELASSRFCADCSHSYFGTPYENIIFANKPRIDVLFTKEMQYKINDVVTKIKDGRKAFVYMPTHRMCGTVTMNMNDILDLDTIQQICENNNCVFLIKKHFYHRLEKDNLDKYSNIFDISEYELDSQVLLAQADVLITDYSSCFVDFLALNRPIVFYGFDYDDYLLKERDYQWKYDKITAGYTAKTREDFNTAIASICNDWSDKIHIAGRVEFRRIYFDDAIEMGTSCKKVASFVSTLINGKYKPYNWGI